MAFLAPLFISAAGTFTAASVLAGVGTIATGISAISSIAGMFGGGRQQQQQQQQPTAMQMAPQAQAAVTASATPEAQQAAAARARQTATARAAAAKTKLTAPTGLQDREDANSTARRTVLGG